MVGMEALERLRLKRADAVQWVHLHIGPDRAYRTRLHVDRASGRMVVVPQPLPVFDPECWDVFTNGETPELADLRALHGLWMLVYHPGDNPDLLVRWLRALVAVEPYWLATIADGDIAVWQPSTGWHDGRNH